MRIPICSRCQVSGFRRLNIFGLFDKHSIDGNSIDNPVERNRYELSEEGVGSVVTRGARLFAVNLWETTTEWSLPRRAGPNLSATLDRTLFPARPSLEEPAVTVACPFNYGRVQQVFAVPLSNHPTNSNTRFIPVPPRSRRCDMRPRRTCWFRSPTRRVATGRPRSGAMQQASQPRSYAPLSRFGH